MSNNTSQKAHVAQKHYSLSRRNTSTTKLTVVANTKRPGLPRAVSSPRLPSSRRKRVSISRTEPSGNKDEKEEDTEDEMATSFLQFCAFCEKQIVVPNHSILYCSERCRRKDIGDSTDASLPLSPKRSPPLNPQSINAPAPLVRQRAPSILTNFDRRPTLLHAAKSDLDPTEWKPHSTGVQRPEGDPPLTRAMSNLVISPCGETSATAGTQPSHVHSSPCSYQAGAEPAVGHVRARSSAALSFLAEFHRSPDTLSFTPRASYSTKANGFARTAPGYFSWIMGDRAATEDSLASASTSVTESGPGTPREGFKAIGLGREEREDASNVVIRGASSSVSLKSLAVAVEARDEEGFSLVEGVWMAGCKAQAVNAGDEAKGKLKKLLAGP